MTAMRRSPERLVMSAAVFWQIGLAAITLFPYRSWLEDVGQTTLHASSADIESNVLNHVSGVLSAYGLILLAGALITALLAFRLTMIRQRTVVIWLAACLGGAMLTTDLIAALLYSVALVLYVARNRAASKLGNREQNQTQSPSSASTVPTT
jgi:hypothetical protein